MKSVAIVGMVGLLLVATPSLCAQEGLPKAEPTKEHQWLKQFVGQWEGDVASTAANTRLLDGLWMVSDIKAKMGDKDMSAMLTLGYDQQKKKYVGTWIDTAIPHLWVYEGTVDASGKILTLETQGPNPAEAGKVTKMRDVIEVKSPDHFALISSMQTDDGQWQPFMTVNYRRKK
jgi:hypothetical protein